MADATAGAALGGVAGAAVGGPAGAVAGAALGAAVAQGSVPGRRGTVQSKRVAAAKAAKPKEPPRMGALAAVRKEIGDRLAGRGDARLADRRPGTEDTVRFTRRTPRPDGGKVVAFVRPVSRDVSDDIPKPAPTSGTPDIKTHRERGGVQPSPAPGVPTTPVTTGDPIVAKAADRSTHIMPTSRYVISLEPPMTDGEFLEQSRGVSQALTGLAEQIEAWTDGLAALNMPAGILESFQAIPEGLVAAAQQAVAGAQQFETHFEEARGVAQRGMRIDGTDAA